MKNLNEPGEVPCQKGCEGVRKSAFYVSKKMRALPERINKLKTYISKTQKGIVHIEEIKRKYEKIR